MSVGLKISGSMDEMLDWLAEEPCSCVTIGYAVEETDYSRETVRSNLQLLDAAGHADLVHEPTALYRLKSDPRDD